MERRFIYLHGFASSPHSFKAQFLVKRFEQIGHALEVPDLNQEGFYSLTLTRQIQQIASLIGDISIPVTLIGSSFGGVTAAWLAEHNSVVDRLVLLAPAFHFTQHWFSKLGAANLQAWRQTGRIGVYHYGQKRFLDLSYEFVQDLEYYNDAQINRLIPTLILHGINDEVIPLHSSQQFSQNRSWVTLHELNSDHGLSNVIELIWQAILEFCQIPMT